VKMAFTHIFGRFSSVKSMDDPAKAKMPSLGRPNTRFERVPAKGSDRAFLPAALEIIETPPSPVAVSMIAILCTFVVAALAWCWFGRLDVYATARGKVIPSGYIKVVQPIESGMVLAIDVGPNQFAKAGDIVLRLDTGEVSAEIAADTQGMVARRGEALRRRAELVAVASGPLLPAPTIAWPDDIPDGIRQREEGVLAGDLNELAAAVTYLEKERLEKEASVQELDGSIAAQTRLLATLQDRVILRQALIDKSIGTKTGLYDAIQAQREGETQLAGMVGKREGALAAGDTLKAARAAKIGEFCADNARKMAEANRLADEKEADRTKAQVKLEHMTLRAPVDGIVQALSVTSIGQVVSPGQELMRLVPSNQPLEIQAFVTNEDIGFVLPGQAAVVKVDAFPFSRYGTLDATVEDIAKDAIPADTANRELVDQTKTGNQAEKRLTPMAERLTDLVFEAKLRPSASAVNVNKKDLQLSPGMTVTVEIKTASRRIIDYLFSPLVEVVSKAMKER
jgi:hemolysin D